MQNWIIGGIVTVVAGIGAFFGLNYYEQENNCNINISQEFPFIACDYYSFPGFNSEGCSKAGMCLYKPLILLYPQKDIPVQVKLHYDYGFSAVFPEYDTDIGGWSIVAHPDGTLTNLQNKREYYGLFWEGNPAKIQWDMSHGFIVSGNQVRDFLDEKLIEIGLSTKEKSDFIMYWYPLLQKYPYLQITFAGKEYTDIAKLDITPKPDSLLRLFMVAKILDKPLDNLPEQEIKPFHREGFSVVEWGGTLIQ